MLPRAAGEEAEQDERIVKQIRRGVAIPPIRPARNIDAKHVIGCGQVLVPDSLRGLGKLANRRRIATNTDIDQRQCHTKLHLEPPSLGPPGSTRTAAPGCTPGAGLRRMASNAAAP